MLIKDSCKPAPDRKPTEGATRQEKSIDADRPRADMCAAYHVQPPESFTFSSPEEWPKWARRFERFRSASGLSTKGEVVQVNTLLYSMGDEADDILRSFKLSSDELKKYDTVKAKFDQHFVKKRNVIFERAKFNMRKQEEGEPVDAFVTDLYALAEHCSFGALHDEMIRDRLVVGLLSARLSEKLQLDAEFTLEKAITQVRQAEAIKFQQSLIRGEGAGKPDIPVGSVNKRRSYQRPRYAPGPSQNKSPTQSNPAPSSTGVALPPDTTEHNAQHVMQNAESVGNGGITRKCAGPTHKPMWQEFKRVLKRRFLS